MQMIELFGTVLQLLSAASIVAALAVILMKTIKPSGALPAQPEQCGWFRPGYIRALLWASAAAIGSRALLAGLAYLSLALANSLGTPEIKHLLADYGFGKVYVPLEALFNRWDGPHYLDIARQGYTADKSLGDQWLFIVFYPLYPAITALLTPLFQTEFHAATALSWACLAGACYWIYRLSKVDNDTPEARRAVKYLLIFPAAVFLGAPYTESLFLLLSALCLYSLRKGNWWLAGVMGFLASLTRNLGALLIVPFAIELIDRLGAFTEPKKLKTGQFWLSLLKNGAWMLLIPLGVGAYLLINHIVYGDPFMFLKIQSDHWGQSAQPFWKTILSTWGYLTGQADPEQKLYLWGPQFIGMVMMLAALPFLVRKLRPAHAAYLFVYVIVALSPSWLLSFNRYMMGAVPLFLGIAALTRRRWADTVLTIVFAAAMLFLAAGYIMWKHVV